MNKKAIILLAVGVTSLYVGVFLAGFFLGIVGNDGEAYIRGFKDCIKVIRVDPAEGLMENNKGERDGEAKEKESG